MFNGTGVTICMNCNQRIHTEPGICVLCGAPLPRLLPVQVAEQTETRTNEADRPSWDKIRFKTTLLAA